MKERLGTDMRYGVSEGVSVVITTHQRPLRLVHMSAKRVFWVQGLPFCVPWRSHHPPAITVVP